MKQKHKYRNKRLRDATKSLVQTTAALVHSQRALSNVKEMLAREKYKWDKHFSNSISLDNTRNVLRVCSEVSLNVLSVATYKDAIERDLRQRYGAFLRTCLTASTKG